MHMCKPRSNRWQALHLEYIYLLLHVAASCFLYRFPLFPLSFYENRELASSMNHSLLAASFLSGILCHVAVWIRGEWDEAFPTVLAALIIAHHAVAASLTYYLNIGFFNVYLLLLRLELFHFLGTAISICIYRIYLHPLKRFPGPFWAKVSTLWKMKVIYSTDYRQAVVLDDLHRQYGDIVRIGRLYLALRSHVIRLMVCKHQTSFQSTLHRTSSIVHRFDCPNRGQMTDDDSAVPLIHGSGSHTNLVKGAAYLNPMNGGSLNAEFDLQRQRLRRLKWDKALSLQGELIVNAKASLGTMLTE